MGGWPGDGLATAPRILWADDHLLAVDKPTGMPSVPARSRHDPPDVGALLAHVWGPLEAAHRLDRDTSGVLLLARSALARRRVGAAFEGRTVGKEYVAVVHGVPPTPVGTVHLPLAPDPDRAPRQRVDPIIGRPAITRWRTLARSADGTLTLLALEPVTGRSHQLRAHLAWLGTPIHGDALYGAPPGSSGRMLLHAARIGFPHPLTGNRVDLLAPACFPPLGGGWRDVNRGVSAGAPSG
ncbi:MAG: RluA family pseudouridine synthase [Pirellulales bacterium]|jgi:tRNA pseudouridine32 synthase/23S rRNA pseudouridine746 synthase